MKNFLTSILGIALTTGLAVADPIVLIEIDGVVTSSRDDTNYVGFGAGNGVFDGEEISISLSYDTSRNPLKSSSNPTRYSGTFPYWMTFPVVNIGGVSVKTPAPLGLDPSLYGAVQNLHITPETNTVRVVRDLDYCPICPDNGSYIFSDLSIQVDLSFSSVTSDAIPENLPASTFISGSGQLVIDDNIFGNQLNTVDARFTVSTASFTLIIPVAIDIKPGKTPNSINPASGQKIPVAILTTASFDALDVFYALEADPLSVEFGPDGATETHGRGHVKDVDDDGDMDLLLHFNTQDTGIACGDTEATLTGETFDGQAITGTDAIKTVNCQ